MTDVMAGAARGVLRSEPELRQAAGPPPPSPQPQLYDGLSRRTKGPISAPPWSVLAREFINMENLHHPGGRVGAWVFSARSTPATSSAPHSCDPDIYTRPLASPETGSLESENASFSIAGVCTGGRLLDDTGTGHRLLARDPNIFSLSR